MSFVSRSPHEVRGFVAWRGSMRARPIPDRKSAREALARRPGDAMIGGWVVGVRPDRPDADSQIVIPQTRK